MIEKIKTKILTLISFAKKEMNMPSDHIIPANETTNWIDNINEYITKNELQPICFDGKEAWIKLKDNLQILYLNKMNCAIPDIIKKGVYEKTSTEFVINNLKEKSVFFDVGCNLGWYSLIVATHFKKIEVHSFEPVPEAMTDFKKNVCKNRLQSKIKMTNLAVGQKNEHAYITTDQYASNYISKKGYPNTTKVNCITIDQYVADNKIEKLDLIKCDVEGKELSVVKGALNSLKKFKPILIVELIDNNPSKFENRECESPEETIALLSKLGYKCCIIDDDDKIVPIENINNINLTISFHNYIFYFDKINMTGSQI